MSGFTDKKATTINLQVWLSNSGGSPARDTHIFLHFPDGIEVYDEDSFEAALAEPREPQAPVRGLPNVMVPRDFLSLAAPIRMPTVRPIRSNVSGWSVKRSDSSEVRASVRELIHGLRVELDELFVVFESREAVGSFCIDYQLLAANLPERVARKLHVIVES